METKFKPGDRIVVKVSLQTMPVKSGDSGSVLAVQGSWLVIDLDVGPNQTQINHNRRVRLHSDLVDLLPAEKIKESDRPSDEHFARGMKSGSFDFVLSNNKQRKCHAESIVFKMSIGRNKDDAIVDTLWAVTEPGLPAAFAIGSVVSTKILSGAWLIVDDPKPGIRDLASRFIDAVHHEHMLDQRETELVAELNSVMKALEDASLATKNAEQEFRSALEGRFQQAVTA